MTQYPVYDQVPVPKPQKHTLLLVITAIFGLFSIALVAGAVIFAQQFNKGYENSKQAIQVTLETMHSDLAQMKQDYAQLYPESDARYSLTTNGDTQVIAYGDPDLGGEILLSLEPRKYEGLTITFTAEVYTGGLGYHIRGRIDEGLNKANGRIDDTGQFYSEVTE